MPTADEQRQLQKEYAETDERFWSTLQDLNASTATDHKGLLAKKQRAIADSEAAAKEAAANAERAKERLAKIEKGKDVAGGLGKPVDLEAALLTAGFTKRQLRNMRHLNALLTELESRGIEKDFWDAHRKHLAASDLRTNRPPNAMCFASTALGGGIDPSGRLGRPRRGGFSGERSSATPSRYDLAD